MLSHGALKTDPFDRNVEGNVFDRKDCLDLPFFFSLYVNHENKPCSNTSGLEIGKNKYKNNETPTTTGTFHVARKLESSIFLFLTIKGGPMKIRKFLPFAISLHAI